MTRHYQLRHYQEDCLSQLKKFHASNQNALVTIPTGGGKTIVFTTYAKDKKTLVISHTDELVKQAADKAAFVYGTPDNCGLVQRDYWDHQKKFVSASIQTLYSNIQTQRFKELVTPELELVIVDEAHHTSASTYMGVLNEILRICPNVKILGVTATPFRMDEKDLKDFYQDLVYFIDIKELIRLGYLVPVNAKIVSLDIDLDNINNSSGGTDVDFNQKQLAGLFNNDEITKRIVDKWIELGQNRKTIFFTSSVEHSLSITAELCARGIEAMHIDGNLPLKKREEAIRRFKDGEIKVLSNMNILTEGFDEPSVDCVALIRPTQSKNLYAQIIGRGLRTAPDIGKKDCLVLDYTGVSKKHKLANLFDLFGVTVETKYQDATKEFKIGSEVNQDGERSIKVLFADEDGSFDFFGNDASEFITVIDSSKKVISCGKNNKFVLLEKTSLGLWKLSLIQGGNNSCAIIESIDNMPDDYALSFAIDKWHSNRDEFAKEFVAARTQKPTDAQMVYLKQLVDQKMITQELCDVATRFDASNLLSWGFYLSKTKLVSLSAPKKITLDINLQDNDKKQHQIFEVVSLYIQGRVNLPSPGVYSIFKSITNSVSKKKKIALELSSSEIKINEFFMQLDEFNKYTWKSSLIKYIEYYNGRH